MSSKTGVFTSNPNSDDRDYSKPWEFSDIMFLVEGKRVYSNKNTLMMASEAFRTMLTANPHEKEIALPGKDFQAVFDLMRVIHLPPRPITATNVYRILPLAHEYQMQYLVDECDRVLNELPPSVKHLNLADKFGLEKLRAKNLQYAKQVPYSQLPKEEGFCDITETTRHAIVKYKTQKKGELV